MSFASFAFIGFYFAVAFILALTNIGVFKRLIGSSERLSFVRRWLLLIASFVFCGWADWRFAVSLFGVATVAYFCALNINRGKERKLWVWIGVVAPLIALAVFKYTGFFLDSIASVLHIERERLGTFQLILPIGLSFYTFQAISYVVDVYRGKITASESFSKVVLYMAFFPRLVAGPIVKASYFLPQLEEDRNISWHNLEIGVQIFLIGLFKKIVVADRLAPFVDSIYATPLCFHGFTVALAVFAYALQIYFDFAGYSDMAIGVAKTLGYDLPKNFNFPYLSRNPSEFWKRWHISLSSWLMEYLYIPLGGNRKGRVRTYINLGLTMLLGGLWHGASWAFVAWGGLHGAALCVHKFFRELTGTGKSPEKEKSRSFASDAFSGIVWFLSVIGTFIWVACCWIPFRADSFQDAWTIFTRMFVWNDGVFFVSIWPIIYGSFLVVASIVAVIRYRRRLHKVEQEGTPEELKKFVKTGVEMEYPIFDLTKFWSMVIVLLFFYATLCFAHFGYSPFVYVQF